MNYKSHFGNYSEAETIIFKNIEIYNKQGHNFQPMVDDQMLTANKIRVNPIIDQFTLSWIFDKKQKTNVLQDNKT